MADETRPDKRESPGQLLGRIERMRDLLQQVAIGGSGVVTDDAEFRELRASLRTHGTVGPLLPQFLKSVRSLDDWWVYIKPKFERYVERRRFIADQFDPVLSDMEERYPGVTPIPPPRPERAVQEDRRRAKDMTEVFDVMLGRVPATGKPGPRVPVTRRDPVLSIKTQPSPKSAGTPCIFVVHGRDHGPRDSVARLLERLHFEAVILEEQPNQGRTIIEKFEDYADVVYAVVVMTPDDMGGTKGDRARQRARQNVILELGFFIGKLGRDHVAAIVVGDLERPSDVDGVIYIPFDSAGQWKTMLAKELRATGLTVDMNLL